ncbi:MAG: AmmeMemoRadiSam system radical SAM enzyme [Planctomycetes bacterium]|nr:AmmeMemoRadiSam system radical SAM enzyme [Planctomycetota bacterium]
MIRPFFYKPEGMSRRDFVREVTRWGTAIGLSPAVLQTLCAVRTVDAEDAVEITDVQDTPHEKAPVQLGANCIEVPKKYYDTVEKNAIRCYICARNCHLPEGKTCFCYTRTNRAGKLYSYAFNNPCTFIPDDPVEKGPFFHFMPETKTFSVAIAGCMLRCAYCQNWEIAQIRPTEAKNYKLDKKEVMARIKNMPVKSFTYTYTDPIAFFEWMMEMATHAKENKLKNLMVTSGYIREAPLKEACQVIDAFCITIKGFTEPFYEKVIGGRLQPVLRAIEVVKEQKKWLEIPYLIVPTYNDGMAEIKEMCKWVVKNCGTETPVHFARFKPSYKMKNLPEGAIKVLENARKVGLDCGLKFVYIANVPGHAGNNTLCPNCKKVVINRVGFKVIDELDGRGEVIKPRALDILMQRNGACKFCGKKVPGVWV